MDAQDHSPWVGNLILLNPLINTDKDGMVEPVSVSVADADDLTGSVFTSKLNVSNYPACTTTS